MTTKYDILENELFEYFENTPHFIEVGTLYDGNMKMIIKLAPEETLHAKDIMWIEEKGMSLINIANREGFTEIFFATLDDMKEDGA